MATRSLFQMGIGLGAALLLVSCSTPIVCKGPVADPKAMVDAKAMAGPAEAPAETASAETSGEPGEATWSVADGGVPTVMGFSVSCKKVIASKYAGDTGLAVAETEASLRKVGRAKTAEEMHRLGIPEVPAEKARGILRIEVKIAGGVSMLDLMAGQMGIEAKLYATVTRDGLVSRLNEGKGITHQFKLPATRKEGTDLIRLSREESDKILDENLAKIVDDFFTKHRAFLEPLQK